MSDKEIRFYVDQNGVNEVIYRDNNDIKLLEEEVMNRVISEARATFFQEFGFDPYFYLEFQYRPVGGKSLRYIPGGKRPVYRIRTDDPRAKKVLKENRGWLSKFAENAKL